ncbi:hypothetical protein ScPMuIL_005435 [Solemya velum]
MDIGLFKDRWMLFIAATALALTLLIPPAESCYCPPQSNAAHFCDAKFALKARVYNSRRYDDFSLQYDMAIKRVLKTSEEFRNTSHEILIAPTESSLCSIILQDDAVYLLTGFIMNDQLWVNGCSWVREWTQLPRYERRRLRRGYRNVCEELNIHSASSWNLTSMAYNQPALGTVDRI